MSALPPKADIVRASRDVRFVPKADIPQSRTAESCQYVERSKLKAPVLCRGSHYESSTLREIRSIELIWGNHPAWHESKRTGLATSTGTWSVSTIHRFSCSPIPPERWLLNRCSSRRCRSIARFGITDRRLDQHSSFVSLCRPSS